jgi:hypothetical protein
MRKNLLLSTLALFIFSSLLAQIEKPPVYPGCESESLQNINSCFNYSVKKDLLDEFDVPAVVDRENYKGKVKIVFLVTREGKFEVLYVNSMYPELEAEVRRVFGTLPKVQPATFNGREIDQRFQMAISVPLKDNSIEKPVVAQIEPQVVEPEVEEPAVEETKEDIEEKMLDIDDTLFPEFRSELNIPFAHQEYDKIIYSLNRAENTHTASKPYVFNEVRPYIDLEAQRTEILKDKKSWGGRKLWNEHLALVKGKNFWFTLNPVFDLQVGKDNSDVDFTYNNTRGLQIQGSLGKKFSFSTSFYESQGRFAQYINQDTRRLRPIIGASAVVHGRGKAKSFKEGGFDYPVAEAYLSYTPNKFFNFQFGNGKNFIGDGYRSFFLSDVASPYPFLKINTTFWKIKYTNIWAWMDDVRADSTRFGTNFRKYVAMHHLSWNISKRFNLGLFEAVITNENDYNGFDISFFNPIIFYRAVEFSNGGDFSGNVQVGLNLKYRLKDNLSLYGQLLVDELRVSEVFDGSGWWANKFAVQLGAKYYDAFKVDGLMLQGEFNWARPYTFSHPVEQLNAGHYNQAIAHLWGANFWEVIGIARYNHKRWFGNAKLIFGNKGFDFDGSDISYGGDIYVSNTNRPSDYGIEVGQGNSTDIFIADLQAGYVVNPVTNLQLFGGFTFRNFSPAQSGNVVSEDNTTWFTIGLKANLFNWYFDF